MELSRRQIGLTVLAAVLVGAGLAWWNRPEPAPVRPPPSPPGARVAAPEPSERHIYKWQDERGVWNFTDRPPADRPYTEVVATPNVTVLPSVIPESADNKPDGQAHPPRKGG